MRLTAAEDRVALILGRRGYGKSWKLAELAAADMADGWPALFRDPTGSVSERVSELTDVPPAGIALTDDQWTDLLTDLPPGPHLWVVDELDTIRGGASDALRVGIGQGRHAGIRIYAACRRVVEATPQIRGAVSDLYIFRTTAALDLSRLREWGLSAEDLARVPTLDVGECIHVRL